MKRAVHYLHDEGVTADRETFSSLLADIGIDLVTYESSSNLISRFDARWRGCILLSLRRDAIEALSVQQWLGTQLRTPPIVFISEIREVQAAISAIKAGAFDYLLKPVTSEDFITCIRRALAYEEEHRETELIEAEFMSAFLQLSVGEREVLELVVSGSANKNVAARLGISQRSVEDRRARMMAKLGADNLPELVRMYLTCTTKIMHKAIRFDRSHLAQQCRLLTPSTHQTSS